MNRMLFIWVLVGMQNTGMIYAQWTEKDSIWLQGVLSGKEKLQLNPETQRAIESGTLLSPESPADAMKMAPSSVPFTKDFSEYLRIEAEASIRRVVALKDLPPAVFMRYGLDKPLPKSRISSKAYGLSSDIRKNAVKPTGISFDDMLKSIFMPGERAKRRNAKRWQTHKYYNNYP